MTKNLLLQHIDNITEEINGKERKDKSQTLNQNLELFDFSKPLPTKGADTMRLFYNNCNGIEINNTIRKYMYQKRQMIKQRYLKDTCIMSKLDMIIQQNKRWDVDIICLAEINVAWEDKTPRGIIQTISKKYDPTCCWTISSSEIPVGNFIKPGGTGILATNGMSGRLLERGTDPWKLGRWSYNIIRGKHQTLMIVTGYRVGKRSNTAGPSTAWAQQKTLLLKKSRSEEPQKAFLIDLLQWLEQYKSKGHCILLCLDANEKWEGNSDIKEFADKLSLTNINQKYDLGNTHPNLVDLERSTTIDFCLCCEKVEKCITYASLVPYELEILGDHRGIIVDINIGTLLGNGDSNHEIPFRKLTLSNPKAVEKYIETVKEKFEQQSIFKRAKKLLKRVNKGDNDHQNIKKKYEQLDAEIYGICIKAEKDCRKTIAGKHLWSPVLVQCIKKLNYWRYLLKNKKENTIIKEWGKELDIEYGKHTKEYIQQKIKESREELDNIQKKSVEHRKDHLQELANNYANQNNVSMNTAINELIAHEGIRNTFLNLKDKVKKQNTGQLTSLWISRDENGNYTKDNNNKEIYTDEESVHQKILQRNHDHLQQASSTPFARGYLRKDLKYDGTGKLSSNILTGEILNERKFRSTMQLYLESLKMNDIKKMNVINPTITIEEYKTFWKKKRENTVTSPFGLHIGHYKAALFNIAILEVHRVLLLIPFITGIVPKRWRRTVQTMLEKEPGAPWIHRLRIIELFDAQANAGFQIFVGRKMIRHAVENNLLQPESFGSTPGKMAGSAVIQKILSIDQLRIESRAGAIFDCDASGCYDRILPPLASVHLQSLGLNKSIGTFLARLMHLARRHVRTKHGVSTQTISTNRNATLHGIGQGNGGGPAIWVAHLTVMFTAISAICTGFSTSCVQKETTISTVGTGYVDDVTLGMSIPKKKEQTYEMVRRQIKKMGQIWEQLLYISGGRLELNKCFWVPIVWKWKNGKPVMMKQKQHRGKDLTLTLWFPGL